jgi:hypothetical protein
MYMSGRRRLCGRGRRRVGRSVRDGLAMVKETRVGIGVSSGLWDLWNGKNVSMFSSERVGLLARM